MRTLPFTYVLVATLVLGSAMSSAGQVQRILVTGNGETKLDTPVPHAMQWWTQNPLRLDASGNLLLGEKVDGGYTVTARDYQVEQNVTPLGTISGHRIVQVLTTMHAGPHVIFSGLVMAEYPPTQWKSLLVEVGRGRFVEIYSVQSDFGDWKIGPAAIYGSGPNAILGTYDPDGGNGGGCSDGYWWFDHAGIHTVDFTKLYGAVDRAVPQEGTYTQNCWAMHPEESYLESGVQRRDACHTCGWLGTVHASYRIEGGTAIPISVHYENHPSE